MKPQIFYNGEPLDPANAALLAMDHALLYGDCVCETLVAIYSKPLLFEEHLARLSQSAEMIGIKKALPIAAMVTLVAQTLKATPLPKAYIRLTVSTGTGLGAPRGENPSWMLHVAPAPLPDHETYQKGKRLQVRVNPTNKRGSLPKISNYQEALMAKAQVAVQEFNDVLWVNSDREITEATMANIFFLERDNELLRLITPSRESGLLAGITRQLIINLCRSAKILVEERAVLEEEVPRFDEAFLTSSISGLMPIAQIGQHRLHTKRARAHFPYIESLFLTWVHQQVGFAVHWPTGERIVAQTGPTNLQ